ncbi:MAG: hypothetical protein KGL53_10830, partial [Elusimicrobia bacterium]|nr:hypothetical protein [Elusimicrobiota bacterium]
AGSPAAPPVTAVHRTYTLPAGPASDRRAQIQRVLDDLRQAAAQAPPGAQTRFGMNLHFTDRPAGAGAAGDAGDKPKVSYQPRDVGNDLGLWVMGTGWMELVDEVLDSPRPPSADPALWSVVVGLGRSALGDSSGAGQAFEEALAADPKSELAYLGRAVAMVIRGDEAGAIDAYKKALALDPKDRAAAQGLEWLERGPVGAGKP